MPRRSPRPTPARPVEAFLSRAEQDRAPIRESIQQLEQTLRSRGVPVWTAPTGVSPAQVWHDEIGRALHRCDWFLVALSRRSVKRPWVKRELLFALQQQRYEDRIVPLLFEPCDVSALSWTLSGFQMIDFTGDFDEGCRTLLRTWGIALAPEPGPASRAQRRPAPAVTPRRRRPSM